MANVSRHTIRFWEEAAVSFLCDITDQVPIPGTEGTECADLQMSKLRREEAHRMIGELLEALGIDRAQSLRCLAEAWRVRRDAKAERYGWYADEPGVARRKQTKRPAPPGRLTGPQWVQPTLF